VNRYGIDQLTPNGERQHFTLGQQLRADYSDLFNAPAKSQDYEVFSVGAQSAQGSARAHMMGLFPSHKFDTINVNANDTRYPPWLDIQDNFEASTTALPFGVKPVPMKIESESQDTVFFPSLYQACPQAGREQIRTSVNQYVLLENIVKDYAVGLNKQGFASKQYFKKEVWMPEQLSLMYDTIHSLYYYDSQMLRNLKPDDYGKLKLISAMYKISKFFPTDKHLKLYTHRMMEIILEAFTLGPKEDQKYTLLSGLEKNLIAFMVALDLTSFECLKMRFIENDDSNEGCLDPPQFASNLIFELVEDSKHNELVRIRYNGKPVPFCPLKDSDKKQEYCNLASFSEEVSKRLMLASLSAFCGEGEFSAPNTAEMLSTLNNLALMKYALMAGCFGMLLVIVCAWFCVGNRANGSYSLEDKELERLKKSKKGETKEEYDARIKSQPTEPAELEPQPLDGEVNFDASREEGDDYDQPSFRFDQDEIKEEKKEKKGPIDVTDTDRRGINTSQSVTDSYMENKIDEGEEADRI
jgi:hypothetical protein